jgi:hypothetical protein
MKLKIPPADKVFKTDKKLPKKPSIEIIVMGWLNTEVYKEIMCVEPKLSPKSLKVTGRVNVEVPYEYYEDKNSFMRIVKAQLVPLGYDVDFTYDGNGVTRDICIIKWEHILSTTHPLKRVGL